MSLKKSLIKSIIRYYQSQNHNHTNKDIIINQHKKAFSLIQQPKPSTHNITVYLTTNVDLPHSTTKAVWMYIYCN